MKITKLHINEFQQFKDFELDLVYPEGHPKAGKPLDKVCFIGQSGTGKTTLLNLIQKIASYGLNENEYQVSNMKDITLDTFFDNDKIKTFKIKNDSISYQWSNNFTYEKQADFLLSYYSESNVLISFHANFSIGLEETIEKKVEEKTNVEKHQGYLTSKYELIVSKHFRNKFFNFDINKERKNWDTILNDIQNFKIAQLDYRNKIAYQIENDLIKPEEGAEYLKKWKNENVNPIVDLSKKLNLILNKFNLEINPNQDIKSINDLKTIKINQLNGREIPINSWSTGTKQIILTSLPLIKLNTEKSLILIDEPERSFYPDIQKYIVNYYSQLAPEAQFFFATHSPIIASSFEPCERVHLYFGEDGYVKYHKGNAPEGDDPNDLLIKDFLLDSVLGEKGQEMYNEFVKLRQAFLNETDEEKRKELFTKYFTIGKEYGFSNSETK